MNTVNNLVNLFQMDFGHPDNHRENRFPGNDVLEGLDVFEVESFEESGDEGQ